MAKQTKRPAPKDTRTQRERFEQFAREHGATDDVLDKALGEKAERLRTEPKPKD